MSAGVTMPRQKLSEISEKMDKKHQREPSCIEGPL